MTIKEEIVTKIFDSVSNEDQTLRSFLTEMDVRGKMDMRSMIDIIVVVCNRIDSLEKNFIKDK